MFLLACQGGPVELKSTVRDARCGSTEADEVSTRHDGVPQVTGDTKSTLTSASASCENASDTNPAIQWFWVSLPFIVMAAIVVLFFVCIVACAIMCACKDCITARRRGVQISVPRFSQHILPIYTDVH